jgi:subtilase family serine protease
VKPTYLLRSSGSSLGLSNNTSYPVLTVLAAADTLAGKGTNTFNADLSGINTIFNGINSAGDISNSVTPAAPAGTVAYTPAQVRAAYGVSSLSLDGTGQTIAIVDAYDDPSIFAALDTFDGQFGLTSSGPTLLAQYGNASSFLNVLKH